MPLPGLNMLYTEDGCTCYPAKVWNEGTQTPLQRVKYKQEQNITQSVVQPSLYPNGRQAQRSWAVTRRGNGLPPYHGGLSSGQEGMKCAGKGYFLAPLEGGATPIITSLYPLRLETPLLGPLIQTAECSWGRGGGGYTRPGWATQLSFLLGSLELHHMVS